MHDKSNLYDTVLRLLYPNLQKNNPLVASYHKNAMCGFCMVGFHNFGRKILNTK